MEITGKVINDASVRKTTDKREVVAFTVVVNDTYKAKDGERKEVSEYINCSYWISPKIADTLIKGTIVTVTGRIYLNEFKGKDGEQHANLAFHANAIKIIATAKRNGAAAQPTVKKETTAVGAPETADDLPF